MSLKRKGRILAPNPPNVRSHRINDIQAVPRERILMRVVCAICGDVFESLVIDRDAAFQELVDQTSKHAHLRHTDRFKVTAVAIKKSIAAIGLLLHCGEFMVVPSQESFILKKLGAARDACMIAAGFEPEEQGEDEEEQEGKEDEHTGNEGSDQGKKGEQETANGVGEAKEVTEVGNEGA